MAVQIVHALTEGQIQELVMLYAHEWWTQGRRPADVRRMLGGSDVIVAFVEPGTQALAAFARVLTDRVYKALVLDVIVAPAYRGTGLGRQLMDAVLHHPALCNVRDFELYCQPDMVPFYQRWGFADDLGPLHFMRRSRTPSEEEGGL